MRAAGWTKDVNVRFNYRWGSTDPQNVALAAADVAALKPNLVVAIGSPVVVAMQRVTTTTQIVFAVVSDPVGQGRGPEPRPSWRQHHRLQQPRARDRRKVARIAHAKCIGISDPRWHSSRERLRRASASIVSQRWLASAMEPCRGSRAKWQQRETEAWVTLKVLKQAA